MKSDNLSIFDATSAALVKRAQVASKELAQAKAKGKSRLASKSKYELQDILNRAKREIVELNKLIHRA